MDERGVAEKLSPLVPVVSSGGCRSSRGGLGMPWWGWITDGALLLAAEMTIVDLEFYLVSLGVSGFVVGLLGLAEVSMPFWL